MSTLQISKSDAKVLRELLELSRNELNAAIAALQADQPDAIHTAVKLGRAMGEVQYFQHRIRKFLEGPP